jgi:hypothetical protein
MTTSACHGVEGYCGSAIQTGLLRGGAGITPAGGPVAVLHVHALNPHGFSHGRRVTQENVDLNRNFIDFSQPLPANPGYARIHPLLLPPPGRRRPRSTPRCSASATRPARAAGRPRCRRASTRSPAACTSAARPDLEQRRLPRRAAPPRGARRHLAWIDLHTGLGPRGVGERIFASIDEHAALDRARRWWGERVTSVTAGTSNSIPLTGPLQFALADDCPGLVHTNVCLEFGTVPLPEMFEALRADHWLHQHPDADPALARGHPAAHPRRVLPRWRRLARRRLAPGPRGVRAGHGWLAVAARLTRPPRAACSR